MLDSKGVITNTRGDTLAEHKKVFCRTDGTKDMKVCAPAARRPPPPPCTRF